LRPRELAHVAEPPSPLPNTVLRFVSGWDQLVYWLEDQEGVFPVSVLGLAAIRRRFERAVTFDAPARTAMREAYLSSLKTSSLYYDDVGIATKVCVYVSMSEDVIAWKLTGALTTTHVQSVLDTSAGRTNLDLCTKTHVHTRYALLRGVFTFLVSCMALPSSVFGFHLGHGTLFLVAVFLWVGNFAVGRGARPPFVSWASDSVDLNGLLLSTFPKALGHPIVRRSVAGARGPLGLTSEMCTRYSVVVATTILFLQFITGNVVAMILPFVEICFALFAWSPDHRQ